MSGGYGYPNYPNYNRQLEAPTQPRQPPSAPQPLPQPLPQPKPPQYAHGHQTYTPQTYHNYAPPPQTPAAYLPGYTYPTHAYPSEYVRSQAMAVARGAPVAPFSAQPALHSAPPPHWQTDRLPQPPPPPPPPPPPRFDEAKAKSAALDAFNRFDQDHGGYLDVQEFMDALRALQLAISYHEALDCFARCDVNEDGRISQDEFVRLYLDEHQKRMYAMHYPPQMGNQPPPPMRP